MTRGDMLVELQEVLGESNIPYGSWEEITLLRYLAEGQDKFCEQTGFFTDLTNFTLTLQTGIAVYAIPDRVIQVLDIWDGTRKLGKVRTGNIYTTQDALYGYTEETGVPTHWQTDLATGSIQLFPTPTAAENDEVFLLQVWRYSLYDLAGTGAVPEGGGAAPPAAPEIPPRFQRACIEWAAHKALIHHDLDTQDKVKSDDHLRFFNGYVADGRTALQRLHNQETRIGSDPAYRT